MEISVLINFLKSSDRLKVFWTHDMSGYRIKYIREMNNFKGRHKQNVQKNVQKYVQEGDFQRRQNYLGTFSRLWE